MALIHLSVEQLKKIESNILGIDKSLFSEMDKLESEINNISNNVISDDIQSLLTKIRSSYAIIKSKLTKSFISLENFLDGQIKNYILTEEEAQQELAKTLFKMNVIGNGGNIPGIFLQNLENNENLSKEKLLDKVANDFAKNKYFLMIDDMWDDIWDVEFSDGFFSDGKYKKSKTTGKFENNLNFFVGIDNIVFRERVSYKNLFNEVVGDENNYAYGRADYLYAEAAGVTYAGLGKDNFGVGAFGIAKASLFHAEGRAQTQYTTDDGLVLLGAGTQGEVDALTASVKGTAQAGCYKDKNGKRHIAVEVGADVRADLCSATATGNVTVAGVNVIGGVTGRVGVGAEFNVGYSDGKFNLNAGVALGLGLDVNLAVDVGGAVDWVKDKANDVSDAVSDFVDSAKDVASDAWNTVKESKLNPKNWF